MRARDLLSDIAAAFGLLTRLPLPGGGPVPRPAGAWAWPLAGLGVGALAAALGAGAAGLGLQAGVVAALVMAAEAMLTGALHEDGLADCADGFWGGHSRARRLEIMKDSRVGSYGVLALVIAGLARWSALVALVASGNWGAVIAASALARAPMAVVMAALPNARGEGLAARHGAPPMAAALAAAGLALALALVLTGAPGVAMAAAAAGAALVVAGVARAKIGGQTGDVLGATEQLALIAALAAA